MVWPLTLHNVGSGLSREDRGVVHTINCVYMRESNFVMESPSNGLCCIFIYSNLSFLPTFVTSRAENAF